MADAEKIIVRPALRSDAEGVWSAHTRAIRELCASDYSPGQIEAWAGPRKPADYLGPISRQRFFVAESDGRIAGFGEYNEASAEICAIYVHPEFGRSGVGRMLFARVTEGMRREGIPRAWLNASLTSVAFYLAVGCREIGERIHRLGSGLDLPCVRMEIDLE